jgi:hypothetical protein
MGLIMNPIKKVADPSALHLRYKSSVLGVLSIGVLIRFAWLSRLRITRSGGDLVERGIEKMGKHIFSQFRNILVIVFLSPTDSYLNVAGNIVDGEIAGRGFRVCSSLIRLKTLILVVSQNELIYAHGLGLDVSPNWEV